MISARRRQKQDDCHVFQASLAYIVSSMEPGVLTGVRALPQHSEVQTGRSVSSRPTWSTKTLSQEGKKGCVCSVSYLAWGKRTRSSAHRLGRVCGI